MWQLSSLRKLYIFGSAEGGAVAREVAKRGCDGCGGGSETETTACGGVQEWKEDFREGKRSEHRIDFEYGDMDYINGGFWENNFSSDYDDYGVGVSVSVNAA